MVPSGRSELQAPQRVYSLESRLLLADHKSGFLQNFEEPLFRFTRGYIGVLANVLDTALYIAIRSGAERIDLDVLDKAVTLCDGESYDEWDDSVRGLRNQIS